MIIGLSRVEETKITQNGAFAEISKWDTMPIVRVARITISIRAFSSQVNHHLSPRLTFPARCLQQSFSHNDFPYFISHSAVELSDSLVLFAGVEGQCFSAFTLG
jgi:hypothetical protein